MAQKEMTNSQFNELIIKAIKNKDRSKVNDLLESHKITEDVNSALNEEAETPLNLAAQLNLKQILADLISKGYDVNSKNNQQLTPLHVASKENRLDIVKLLIKKGANIDLQSEDGSTALHLSAINGHSEVIQVLLENKATSDIKDTNQRTCLELAIIYDHLDAFERILEFDSDNMNYKDCNNCSLLEIAVFNGQLEIVKYLVENGADYDAENSEGYKPIHIAALEGFKNILEFFIILKGISINVISSVSKNSLLHCAALKNQVNIAEFLIKEGIDINSKNIKGQTALHLVAQSSGTRFIKLLLKNGAFYDSKDEDNKTPLDLSSECNKSLLLSTKKLFDSAISDAYLNIQTLVRDGVNINTKDSRSYLPLHHAAANGNLDTVEAIFNEGGDANVSDNAGITPLHLAVKFSHYQAVVAILRRECIYNAATTNGRTPLSFSRNKHISNLLKLIQTLFEKMKKNDQSYYDDYQCIKDKNIMTAVGGARNEENKSIFMAGLANNFFKSNAVSSIHLICEVLNEKLQKAEDLFFEDKYDAALNLFKQIHKEKIESLGEDNPEVFFIESKISLTLYRQLKYEEALKISHALYSKQKLSLGPSHKDALSTKSFIGLIFYRQKKYEEALKILQDVSAKEIKILGPYHMNVSFTKMHLAMVLYELDKSNEGSKINNEVYENYRYLLGENNCKTLDILSNIALHLPDKTDTEKIEKLKLLEKTFIGKEQAYGPMHSNTLMTEINITTELVDLKRYDEALTRTQKLIQKQTKVLGADHLYTLYSKFTLSKIYKALNDSTNAAKYFYESYPKLKMMNAI